MRIFVVEDNPVWRDLIKRLLQKLNHQVILEADSKEEAIRSIEKLKEHDIEIAIVDGHLDGSVEYDSINDGLEVIETIREKMRNIKIITLSKKLFVEASANGCITKDELRVTGARPLQKLRKVIEKILRRQG